MTALRNVCLALLCCAALAACDNAPAFDASSLPAFRQSLAAINAQLGAQDQRKLQVALMTLMAGGPADFTAFAIANPSAIVNLETLNGIANPHVVLDRIRPAIEGRSANAVIKRVIADLDYDISTAEQELNAAPGKALTAVIVDNTRYSWDRNPNDRPIVEFSVYNGSRVPISTIYLAGELTMSGNDAPLASGDFGYRFPVTLDPGMQQSGKASLGIPGAWSAKQLATIYDAGIRLTLSNADDGDGRRLLPFNVGRLDVMRKKRDLLRGG